MGAAKMPSEEHPKTCIKPAGRAFSHVLSGNLLSPKAKYTPKEKQKYKPYKEISPAELMAFYESERKKIEGVQERCPGDHIRTMMESRAEAFHDSEQERDDQEEAEKVFGSPSSTKK